MSRSIDYGNLMHDAMRGLIRDVLTDVAEEGLPGAHHFFISFDTGHPDVEIADWLSDRFPEDMTIVMQHWFDDLTVDDDGFAITLNFGNQPERMYVPFDAIRTFVDPSVEFGLRFETQDEEDGAEGAAGEGMPHGAADGAAAGRKDRAKDGTSDRARKEGAGDGADRVVPEARMAEDVDIEDEKKDAEIVSLDSFRK